MELTLEQTAVRLGKSKRQVLYLIQTGRLPARKEAGRWSIDAQQLPLNAAQQQSQARKQARLREAVDTALDLEPSGERPRRYSVRDLKAFQIALPLYRQAHSGLGAEHPATHCLKHVLDQLTCGCHRYNQGEKADAYKAARDHASQAVCELVLAEVAVADQLIHAIEQDLLAAMAGLMRRMDQRRRW